VAEKLLQIARVRRKSPAEAGLRPEEEPVAAEECGLTIYGLSAG
jgi:hypothetical protein